MDMDDEARKVLHELRNVMHEMKLESVTRHMEMSNEITAMKGEVKSMGERITEMVTRPEFAPVKMLAYGMAGTILSGAIGAVLTQILVTVPK